MAKHVKVWNDNAHPFTQKFRDGEIVTIGPKQYIEMAWDDAQQFLGMYYPPEFDGMCQQKATSFKMLRIEGLPPHLQQEKPQMIICAACGGGFVNETALSEHIDANHLDSMEDQKLAQKRKAKGAKVDGATV